MNRWLHTHGDDLSCWPPPCTVIELLASAEKDPGTATAVPAAVSAMIKARLEPEVRHLLALSGPKIKVFDEWITEELVAIKGNLPKKGKGTMPSDADWDAVLIDLIKSSSTF